MFGLFKRTKLEDWEIALVYRVIAMLPMEYSHLIQQLDDKLLKGVILDASDIKGYVAFTYDPTILEKYERPKEKDYKIAQIRVFDNKTSSFVNYEIYVSSGTISGYTLGDGKKCELDVNKIDVNSFKIEVLGVSDFNRIAQILTHEEQKAINPSNVYSVIMGNKEYFHIKDLEDGDFIGIDFNGVVYKITHDPLEVSPIDRSNLINM